MKLLRIAPIALLAALGACGQTPDSEPTAGEPAANEPTPNEPTAAQEANDEPAEGSGRVELSPSDGPLLAQLAAHVEQARGLNRAPVIYVHADWCEPCTALDRYAGDPAMVAAFEGTHVARVDLDAFSDQLRPFGLSGTVPAWAGLDDEGRPTSQRIDGGAWGENIPVNMAGPLSRYFRSL